MSVERSETLVHIYVLLLRQVGHECSRTSVSQTPTSRGYGLYHIPLLFYRVKQRRLLRCNAYGYNVYHSPSRTIFAMGLIRDRSSKPV